MAKELCFFQSKQTRLVVAILFGALVIAGAANAFRPSVAKVTTTPILPNVDIITVQYESVKIPVISRGTVIPRTSISLSAQISGEVIEVSSNFVNGGFFKKGDVLIKLNPLQYQLAIHTAEAKVASSKQALAKDQAVADHARSSMTPSDFKNASSFAKNQPQLAEAQANLKASQASLKIATLNLHYTSVIAPFDGRITKKRIDLGEYLSIGKAIADIYSVDYAEIRLPLSDRHLALLDQPWLYQSTDATEGSVVNIKVEFLGQLYTWHANIVRSEGMINHRDRLVYLVAQVKDPYKLSPEQPNRPPLAFGLYVDAIIEGKEFDNIIKLPRLALRNNNQVWIINEKNTLTIKDVTILHKGRDIIYINAGIQHGDRIITTPLDFVSEGMKIQTTPNLNTKRLPPTLNVSSNE